MRFTRRLLALVAFAIVLAHPARAALVSYWSFDGCTLTDASGHNATLTANGSPTCVAGRFGGAWQFNGVDQWLDRGDGLFEPGTRAWSVALWEKSTDNTGFHILLEWYECGATACAPSNAAAYDLGINNGHPDWFVRDDASQGLTLSDSTIALADGAWHFIVATFNPTTDSLKVSIDGARRIAGAVPLGSLTSIVIPLEIGRHFRTGWANPDYYFKGAIDEIRIFDEELTPAAIGNLFVGNSTTAVGDDPPAVQRIDRSWPNPARGGRFTVSFTLPAEGSAELTLIDVAGRIVERPMPERLAAGSHLQEFGAHHAIPPGVYQVRLRQGTRVTTRQVIVLR